LKRALFQRDLWAVFDVLAQAGQQSVFPVPAFEFVDGSPLSAAQERHRATLERKLAQIIHLLALSRRQIEKLPDNYSDAIKSDAFSNFLEGSGYEFLPHDLFATGGGWYEISPSHSFSFSYEPPQVLEIMEHTLVAGGRSVFRAFVKLPQNSQDTNILADYAAANVRVTKENDRHFAEWQQFWATNNIARSNLLALTRQPEAWRQFALTNSEAADNLRPKDTFSIETEWIKLPSGTQFLLLREMISLDENGQMVPTHVVESVQFRTDSNTEPSGSGPFLSREVELSRALLFGGRQGGLRPISSGEMRASFYNSLGHLRVDKDGNGPFQRPFPENCGQCHTSKALVSPVAVFLPAERSGSIESIVHWKQKGGKLDLLRELILAPTSHGK
jgi:hypothetical protein